MWGTYWQWADARLVTWVVQFFLYVGYIVLHASFDDRDKADRISAILALVGVVNAPIIYYSVFWWTTLHQEPGMSEGSIEASMLVPLLTSILGFVLWFAWAFVNRLQAEIVERERDSRWLADFLPPMNSPAEAAK
jgi:heme exporter protein C